MYTFFASDPAQIFEKILPGDIVEKAPGREFTKQLKGSIYVFGHANVWVEPFNYRTAKVPRGVCINENTYIFTYHPAEFPIRISEDIGLLIRTPYAGSKNGHQRKVAQDVAKIIKQKAEAEYDFCIALKDCHLVAYPLEIWGTDYDGGYWFLREYWYYKRRNERKIANGSRDIEIV